MPTSDPNNLAGKIVAPMMLGLVGLMIWMVASSSIQDIRYARLGSPPMEQLQRVEGTVVRWVNCSKISKFSWRERVSLRSDAGTTSVSMPCILPVDVLSDGRPHRVQILIRPDKDIVYDIALDGKTLLSYATVKQAVDDAAPKIKFAAFMLTILLIVFGGLLWAVVVIWQPSRRRALES